MKTGEPLPVGHLLDGRYRIHKLLGTGGMGRVYLANDTRLANRPVAVKEMILGDGVQERKAVEDFNREASVLARLSHPSIPQIIDYFGEQGRHYLVMEYVAGGDLQHRLDEMGAGARFREASVLEMARQLLDVLQFLHSQKPPIVYRDLKPANIMIDHHGRAMLIDFGIARFLPPGGRGTQIGSVGYAPPEQYLGKMEPRSDLYALAATMHHLLTGRDPQLQPPFSFPPLTELAPEVSAQTARVIMAALDKEVGHRPASALVMRDLLPKPAAASQDTSGALAASTGSTARPAIVATATVVLDRSAASSKSPTPRSLAQTPSSAPIASPRSIPPSPAQFSSSVAHKVQAVAPPSILVARIGTQPELHLPVARDSVVVSSTTKTADLGLKKPQRLGPDASRNLYGEPGKAHSRVAAAFASMRAAMAANSLATTTSASPTLAADRLLNAVSPVRSHNESRDYAHPTPQVAGAWLVSVADGMQFGVSGSRLVLGRAIAKGDGVDIDLSNLRRGAERISRRHAEIIKQGNDYFVRDLGSVNGTYIAGRGRLGRDQLYKLKDRDELVLGGAKLQFRRN
ncbi:MAG: protein kinase [Deltaproteobacteria bacterium]|nr:protein kinase [Deltaproteobacteria bacterium]